MQISVIIPVRNECANIRLLIEELARFRSLNSDTNLANLSELVIVNDHSSDSTAEEITRRAAEFSFVRYAECEGFGKGAALKAGFVKARCPILVMMDGDLQHLPEYIPKLIEPLETDKADLVVGARHGSNPSFFRHFLSWGLSWIFYRLFGLRLSSPNEGFKAIRKEIFDNIPVEANGFSFDLELLIKAAARGYRIVQIPMVIRRRLHGRSKVNSLKVSIEMLSRMLKLWYQGSRQLRSP